MGTHVRWGPISPRKKGAQPPSPIFGQCLLWPNVWMDQDATWYGCRPQQRGICVRLRFSPPSPISAHVYCGQTAGWIKIPLGMEVGLGSGHIVLHENPAHLKGAQPPIFGPCLLWPNGRPPQLLLNTCYRQHCAQRKSAGI